MSTQIAKNLKENRNVIWDNPKGANNHALILGVTGSGKTYGINELSANLSQNAQVIIFDYSGSYTDSRLTGSLKRLNDEGKMCRLVVYKEKIQLNMFDRLVLSAEDGVYEKDIDVACRVADLLRKALGLTKFQEDRMVALICNELRCKLNERCTKNILEDIFEVVSDPDNSSKADQSIATKMRKLLEYDIIKEGNQSIWNAYLQYRIVVIDLSFFAENMQNALVEMIAYDYWRFRLSCPDAQQSYLVFDEFQRLDFGASSILRKLVAEGRKFGVYAILATQTLANTFKRDQLPILYQCGLKICFKLSAADYKALSNIFEDGDVTTEDIASLTQGECYSIGQFKTIIGTTKRLTVKMMM